MASTFFGLDIGSSGLFASMAGLNTTAHNISNIETKGYSRQIINQTASNPLSVGSSYGMVGTGVDIVSIEQQRDAYYDTKFWNNNALYGLYSERNYFLSEVEGYLNEIELEGFTTTFDSMYKGLQEIVKDASSTAARTSFSNTAQSLCDYFNFIDTGLRKVQESCNIEIKSEVERINTIAEEVASLTRQINTKEMTGETANDLRDKRALLIDELSNMINVDVKEQKYGTAGGTTYIVKINGNVLVDTFDYNTLGLKARENKVNQTDATGLYDIVWEKTGNELNVSAASMNGSLKAILEVRDGNNNEDLKGTVSDPVYDAAAEKLTFKVTGANINNMAHLNVADKGYIMVGTDKLSYDEFSVEWDDVNGEYVYTFTKDMSGLSATEITDITGAVTAGKSASVGSGMDYKGIPYYLSEMNEFVRTFALRFNKIHESGVDLNGDAGLNFFTGKDKVTGDDIILGDSSTNAGMANYYKITVENLTVNNEIYKDPNKFAAASDVVAGVSNADIAEKLVDLKKDSDMFKEGDPASFLRTMIASLGIDSKAAENFETSQNDLLGAIKKQRLSVSGVDMDEESMNLVRYQSAYNLASKVISVMDEVYDRLINYMGA